MKICTLANKVKKSTGAGYILRAGKYGTTFAEFCAVGYADYDKICAKVARIKGVEWEAFHWNKVVRLWTLEDWNIVKTNNAEAEKLVNGFWETLHNFGRSMADKYFADHAADYARLGI